MEIHVTRRQGNFVVDASFQGAESGVTALYGPSGAGKTSIVNMVAGLMRPDSGRIALNGLCLFDSARRIDLPPEKRRNLTYGMNLTPAARRFVKLDPVVELLGIDHLLDRRPARLSGGEKQRVAIGRALLTSPAMLLMDEPLASLDAARKAEVLPFIMRLSHEFAVPILYVSHATDEILNLATHLVMMEAGRVLACGQLEKLLSRPDLQTRFGSEDSGAIIVTVVEDPADADGLTHLRFGSNILKIAPIRAARGDRVRVRIPARYVAIALQPPDQTSFQNVFPGRVREIRDHGDAFADVRLDIGCLLWARITRKSIVDLDLKPDRPVYALIKSIAITLGPSNDSQ
jgi:molybdate transport system ATP-binding protein